MRYFDDLKTIVQINSYTKNKAGVDIVGHIFDKWFTQLGFDTKIFERELIGSHRYYTSKHKENSKNYYS